jgi:NAD+ synthase (glutamine-hydrolysing)
MPKPVCNEDIARIFEKMSRVLSLKGGNRFRIIAYENAARSIRELDEASPETIAKADYRRTLVSNQSARCNAAYVYTSSSSCVATRDSGESTADVVFGGHAIIAENGVIVGESRRFESQPQLIVADIDIERLMHERTPTDSWAQSVATWNRPYRKFMAEVEPLNVHAGLRRQVDALPFVPREPERLEERCREVLAIQQAGLSRRLRHVQATTNPGAPVRVSRGVSGGIDSMLALLVAVQTYDRLGWDRHSIIGITMPGFGTTTRTHQNAVELCRELSEVARSPCRFTHD